MALGVAVGSEAYERALIERRIVPHGLSTQYQRKVDRVSLSDAHPAPYGLAPDQGG